MSIQNYHRHSHYTNIIVPDSVTTNEEYALRAKQLDSKIIASTEHAWQGNYYEVYELAKKHDLKFIFGSEIYWVLDRKSEDKTNAHMCLLAKSEVGRRAINKALATANKDGYYYRPRLDLELIFSLPPDDVFITTACIAYWQYENIEDLTLQFYNHFKSNFNLEVQYHQSQKQILLNQKIKELSSKFNIPIIVGLDSHYILEEEKQKRLDYLEGRGIVYKDTDESEWFMDYCDDETIIKRFQQQGIFSDEEIKQAIKRTDVLLTFDNISFDSSTKMVSLYRDKTQEEKNQLYKSIINREFKKYAKENNLTKEEIESVYKQGIQLEANTVIETGMADYFLLDYEIVKKGIEKGGIITPTGRGSGVSFFTNTLLGFSKIDRFKAPIHLYPERFMSKSRILESKQCPDLDLNLGNPEVFAEAQRELLGENHAYPMIAFGKMKKKSAFKMYARATNVPFDEANEIGKQIEKYELALKYADDEDKDLIDIYEYVDRKYEHHIENSKQYEKIVTSKSSHPCAWMLYCGEIDEEVGLIRCKSETTGKDTLVTVVDGITADKYGFLKNDLLKVDVVMLNHVIAQRIGIEIPSFVQLLRLIENDGGKTWAIYELGATSCINQVAKKSTAEKVMRYKPKSDGELACFVAAIRPSFKSLYKQYENREHFEYGIPSLDKILQTEQIPESFIFFQEQMMRVMNYAGIPMDQTYDIIKNISKKRPEKVLKYKEIFLKGFAEKLIKNENRTHEEAQELSATIWKIVEDFCQYGFNACISGKTKISRAGKNQYNNLSIEEMYKIKNDKQYAYKTGHKSLYTKYKKDGYGTAQSMFPDGRIRLNKIINIYQSGIHKTYKVTTQSGSSIICTSNHKFPTPKGQKQLSELNIGDELFIKGTYEINKKRYTFTNGNYEDNYPILGQCGFQNNDNGASVLFYAYREEKVKNKYPCEICITEYDTSKRFEAHHKDFDRTNNDKSNLLWCCASCHKKEHYKNGRVKAYEKGIPSIIDKIVSIEYVETEMVYDIEMDEPAHNFISDSGLITSNSHAYCVAADSLYGAFLKANYTLEFYEASLNYYTEKKKKEKVSELINEAKLMFGIKFNPVQYGHDNTKFVIGEDNSINYALPTIKFCNSKIAKELYKIGRTKKSNFVEVLELIIGIVNSRQLEILILLDYFKEFGKAKKLQKFVELYHFFNERKQFSKSEEYPIKLDVIKQFCKKETEKTLSDFNFADFINYVWNHLSDRDLSLKERIMAEYEYMGYVNSVGDTSKSNYYLVTEVSNKYKNYMIERQNIHTGEIDRIKLKKKTFDNLPIVEKDIIEVKEEIEDFKWYKDDDGKWKQKDEKERILTIYRIVQ